MFKSKNNSAFTIIELIVVIAIIAVLAAIVLANIMTYNAKSKDSFIKSELDQAYIEGAFYSIKNGEDYSNIENNDPIFMNLLNLAVSKSGCSGNPALYIRTPSDGTSCYAVCVKYASDNTKAWCISSVGVKQEVSLGSIWADGPCSVLNGKASSFSDCGSYVSI